jgi:hypothetical protein
MVLQEPIHAAVWAYRPPELRSRPADNGCNFRYRHGRDVAIPAKERPAFRGEADTLTLSGTIKPDRSTGISCSSYFAGHDAPHLRQALGLDPVGAAALASAPVMPASTESSLVLASCTFAFSAS